MCNFSLNNNEILCSKFQAPNSAAPGSWIFPSLPWEQRLASNTDTRKSKKHLHNFKSESLCFR
jgi:hypothetical protein